MTTEPRTLREGAEKLLAEWQNIDEPCCHQACADQLSELLVECTSQPQEPGTTTEPRTLRELVQKWRDRANEEEYKLHREWAIDLCADELEAALNAERTSQPQDARICSYCKKTCVPNVTACPECVEKYLHSTLSIAGQPQDAREAQNYQMLAIEQEKSAKGLFRCPHCGGPLELLKLARAALKGGEK